MALETGKVAAPSGARWLCVALVCAAAVARPVPAAAQDADRGGAWVALGLATQGQSTVTTAFEPPLLFGLQGSAAGSQAVQIDGSTGIAFEAGAQWFPSRVVGLEVWVSRDASDDQTPSVYETSLTYISRPPPDNLPREFQYDASQPIDVATAIERVTLGVNAALRPIASRRFSWIVSGGMARVRTTCDAAPLGFSTFVLGGHSTLFSNEYRLTVDCEEASTWGANVGTMVDATVAAHLAFTVSARAVLTADQIHRLRVVAVDRGLAGFEPPSDAEIASALSGSVAEVPTASFRLSAGLKVLF
jgi:hypothetical protein